MARRTSYFGSYLLMTFDAVQYQGTVIFAHVCERPYRAIEISWGEFVVMSTGSTCS